MVDTNIYGGFIYLPFTNQEGMQTARSEERVWVTVEGGNSEKVRKDAAKTLMGKAYNTTPWRWIDALDETCELGLAEIVDISTFADVLKSPSKPRWGRDKLDSIRIDAERYKHIFSNSNGNGSRRREAV